MPLFVLVKSSDALDRRIITFGCSGREYYVFWVGTNQIRNILNFSVKYTISIFLTATCLSSIFNSLL